MDDSRLVGSLPGFEEASRLEHSAVIAMGFGVARSLLRAMWAHAGVRGAAGEGEIEQLLEHSTALWHVCRSQWMELRTANLRGRLAIRTGNAQMARDQLSELCERFSNAPNEGRVAEARELLARLG